MGHAVLKMNSAHLNPVRPSREYRMKYPAIDCTNLAKRAFGSPETWRNHMSYDYRQYYRNMPRDKEIFALRTEHLWEDWVEINHILGSEDDAYKNWTEVPPFQETQREYSSKYKSGTHSWSGHDMSQSLKLGKQEREWLCLLLYEEIQTYLTIIARAVNLNEQDLLEAASDVERICGGQDNVTSVDRL